MPEKPGSLENKKIVWLEFKEHEFTVPALMFRCAKNSAALMFVVSPPQSFLIGVKFSIGQAAHSLRDAEILFDTLTRYSIDSTYRMFIGMVERCTVFSQFR